MDPMLLVLRVSLVGISVVFVALLLIAGVISLLARFDEKPTKPAAFPEPEPAIPEEIVAVITAAVVTSLGCGVKVKRIRYGKGTEYWSEQGRITIMASHITRQ